MADEEVKDAVKVPEAPKSPAELAAEAKAADELRRKNQIEFNPKVHGVGTILVDEPQSVRELFKYVQMRFDRLERNRDTVNMNPVPYSPPVEPPSVPVEPPSVNKDVIDVSDDTKASKEAPLATDKVQ